MKKPSEAKPAKLPKKPQEPTTPGTTSERAKAVLADDTDERRQAARDYLESERAARSAGLDIPDLPFGKPDAR